MVSNDTYSKRNLKGILTQRYNINSEEIVFCAEDNVKQSLHVLNEELESFGILPVPVSSDLQTSESLKELSIKVINAAWHIIHKHRSLMQLYDQLNDSDHKTVNDNINLKNHVKRLKEDKQKKEYALCEAQERERRLKVQCENMSRNLKHDKEEIKKLKKQAQSKDSQYEHEKRRIMQNSQKFQEQLRKSSGTYVSRDKAMQDMQIKHDKELTSLQQIICRLEQNNRKMLEEINNLKESLELYKIGIDLQVEASGWNDTDS